MDRYLLNDILEGRDYSIWRDKINEVNKEYHDKVYYDDGYKCLRCRRSAMLLWNWRDNICVVVIFIEVTLMIMIFIFI